MTFGAGIYFDGRTSARHDATVTLAASGLQIAGRDGRLLAEWPYDEIEGLAAPDAVLRLGRRGSAPLERLEILDPQFAAAIDVQMLLNGGDRQDALMRVFQLQPRFLRLDGSRLDQQDAGDDLQAVGDAVLHLLQQHVLFPQQFLDLPLDRDRKKSMIDENKLEKIKSLILQREQIDPLVRHRAAGDLVRGISREHLRERALAGAVGPHDGVYFAGRDVERDAAEDVAITGLGVQIIYLEHETIILWKSRSRRINRRCPRA